MATTGTYTPNQLYSIPLAELQSDPNQPLKYLDPQAPNVPKKVLIGLAKNKQQWSMITQYQKYRKAQAKAAAPSTRTMAKTRPAQTMVGAGDGRKKGFSIGFRDLFRGGCATDV